jgi:hypothetical protein
MDNIKSWARLINNNYVSNVELASEEWITSRPSYEIYVESTEENPAYIGSDYVDGYFYPYKPYASWTRDNGKWIPPVPYPEDGMDYRWNEQMQKWELVEDINGNTNE